MSELEEAQEQIGRLTFDIGCMERDHDAERKANADKIKLFADYLDCMIKLESVNPSGVQDIKCLQQTLEVFNDVVVK